MAKANKGTSKPNWLLIKDYASNGLGSVFRVEMDVRLEKADFEKVRELLEATDIEAVYQVLKARLQASIKITDHECGPVHFLAAAFGKEDHDVDPNKAMKKMTQKPPRPTNKSVSKKARQR